MPRESVRRPVSLPADKRRTFLRQTNLLTRRYFAIWRGDYLALLAMLGQSIVVAVLIGDTLRRVEAGGQSVESGWTLAASASTRASR